MGCTIKIKFWDQNCDIEKERVQSEAYQYLGATNFFRLNIYNKTNGNIEYDDIRELFKELGECNTDIIEFDGFEEKILRELLGN